MAVVPVFFQYHLISFNPLRIMLGFGFIQEQESGPGTAMVYI
jgi:hypothetical protein